MPLGVRHHRRVNDADPDVSESQVELGRPFQQRRGEVADAVLAVDEGGKEQSCSRRADARAQQMVDLDRDGIRNDKVPSQLGYQRSGQAVGLIACVGRCNQRTGVRDDPHRAETVSLK